MAEVIDMLDANIRIELVGGPLCGTKVNWPLNSRKKTFLYQNPKGDFAGKAIYELEIDNKAAIYIEG